MANNVVNLQNRRRLTDLYVRGKELELNDEYTNDEGESEPPIKVWVSKISPLENKESADRAAAARATILAAKHFDDNHEDRIVYMDQLEGLGDRESMTQFLIAPKVQEAQLSHEAEVASEDKWSKDNYLNSLREAWFEPGKAEEGQIARSMLQRYEDNPKDPEAKKVYTELMRFGKEVEKRLDADRIDFASELDIKSDDELRKEVVDRLIETESDYAWLAEFRKWQVYYSVRETSDHKRRYFIDKSEVDALDPRILRQLVDTFLELQVEPIEGKGSAETPSS